MKISLPSSILLVIFLISYSFPSEAKKASQIFDDFKIMKLPRSNVPIGAIWTDIGPVGEGVSSDKLSEGESFQDFTSSTNQNLKANLTGNISTYLKSTVNAEFWSLTTINLESVRIIRVSSTDVLKNNIGQKILYEAIRADHVSFIIDKNKSAELKVNLPKTFSNAEIISDTEIGSKRHIVAKGIGLYVAYRVVKLERGKSKTNKVTFKSQISRGAGSVFFSNSFYMKHENITVTICPCDVLVCANNKLAPYRYDLQVRKDNYQRWLNECNATNNWTILITDSKIFENGKPKEIVYRERLNFNIWNKNYSLSYNLGSNGIEIQYLNIEHLFLETSTMEEGFIVSLGSDPKVTIVSETIRFRNITSSGSHGW